MSDISNALSGYFFSIANAIREKTGRSDPIPLNNMANEIGSISGGNANYDSFYVISGNIKALPQERINIDMNSPLIIGDNITYCSRLMSNDVESIPYVGNFNQPVIFGNNVRYCDSMFRHQGLFNQPINLPGKVENCVGMFYNAINFNSPVVFQNDTDDRFAVDLGGMFNNAVKFNQNITLPNNTYSTTHMFSHTTSFNKPISLPNTLQFCNSMFYNAKAFNQPITIPDNTISCDSMFYNAFNFNSPIVIGNNVNSCVSFLYGANHFNSTIIFGNNVRYCMNMFNGCTAFNKPVTINGAVNCRQLLYRATWFNSPVYLHGNQLNDIAFMLELCPEFHSDVYISSINTQLNIYNAFIHNSIRLHFNSAMNSVFNKSSGYRRDSSGITWTDMSDGNGFYNTAYNIYCYNNYVV